MTIIGKLTSSLLYTTAPVSIITSIIVSALSFINDADCSNNVNISLSNATDENIIYSTICDNVDIVTLKQILTVIAFVWSSCVGLMVFLIKMRIDKLNLEKNEIEKANIETQFENTELKERISNLPLPIARNPKILCTRATVEEYIPSGQVTARSLQPFFLPQDINAAEANEPYFDNFDEISGQSDLRPSTSVDDTQFEDEMISNNDTNSTMYPTPHAY